MRYQGTRWCLSPFTGRDARDVVDEAIRWWDRQLQALPPKVTSVGASAYPRFLIEAVALDRDHFGLAGHERSM